MRSGAFNRHAGLPFSPDPSKKPAEAGFLEERRLIWLASVSQTHLQPAWVPGPAWRVLPVWRLLQPVH